MLPQAGSLRLARFFVTAFMRSHVLEDYDGHNAAR